MEKRTDGKDRDGPVSYTHLPFLCRGIRLIREGIIQTLYCAPCVAEDRFMGKAFFCYGSLIICFIELCFNVVS